MPLEGPPVLGPPEAPTGTSVLPSSRDRPRTVAREIATPFSFDRTGKVAVTRNADAQLRQHVDALVRTLPGERVMKPTYGVSLLPYVFDNVNNVELAAIQDLISTAFDTWVSEARLVKLNAVSGPTNGVSPDTIIVSLQYARRFATAVVPVSADIPVVSM